MIKKSINLLLALSSLFLAWQCENFRELPPTGDGSISANNPGDSILKVDERLQERMIPFLSSSSWFANISQSDSRWLQVTPTSGEEGSNTLLLHILENYTYEERTGTVLLVTKDGSKLFVITVKQSQTDALVPVDSVYHVGPEGGDVLVKLGHNIDYTIDTDRNWISCVNDSIPTAKEPRNFVEDRLTFRIGRNEGSEQREGHIIFTTFSLSFQEKVHVIQAASSPNR